MQNVAPHPDREIARRDDRTKPRERSGKSASYGRGDAYKRPQIAKERPASDGTGSGVRGQVCNTGISGEWPDVLTEEPPPGRVRWGGSGTGRSWR